MQKKKKISIDLCVISFTLLQLTVTLSLNVYTTQS